MRELLVVVLIVAVIAIMFAKQVGESFSTKEDFLSGTDVQLLTSKPYYTWYDYVSRIRRPYFYRYPYPYSYSYVNPYYSYFGRPFYPFFNPFFKPRYY